MEFTERTVRPRGVSFLVIYLAIFAGVLPIVVAVFLLINEEMSQAMAQTTGQTASNILLGMLINIAVLITAVGTWRGNNKVKIAFLIAVTLHYTMIAINNFQIANMDPSLLPADFDTSRTMSRVIRSLIYIIGIWWYFNRSNVRQFYQLKPPHSQSM